MNTDLKKTTLKNLAFSVSAQITSVLLSTLMSLVIPKILGVRDYGYWQLFLFYINYVGFFHFGITDGMYLKTGGIQYKDLNKKELSSMFYCLLIIQVFILLCVTTLSILFISDKIRLLVMIFTGIYMIIANLNWYLGYIFQATNRVKLYSISVIIDKMIFLIFIIMAFLLKIVNLKIYIVVFVFTTFCALFYSIYMSKDIVFEKPMPLKKSFILSFQNAKIGINLTLASVSSLLILGIGRFLVDQVWGIEAFGKFSFALSMTNFFLLFISQISIVLFPTLRQIKIDDAKKLYNKFNYYLDSILPIIYVIYIPMKLILSHWLPQYSVSLNYLAMLLPICIFDGKTQMINNTYFKVLRKERKLLILNLETVVISSIMSFISVYVLKNIYCVIIGMLISITFRSIMGEKILSKDMNIKGNYLVIFLELAFSIAFIIYNLLFNSLTAFILTTITFIAYAYLTNSFDIYFNLVKRAFKRKKNTDV